MERRKFLLASGAGLTLFAGCAAEEEPDDDSGDDEPEEDTPDEDSNDSAEEDDGENEEVDGEEDDDEEEDEEDDDEEEEEDEEEEDEEAEEQVAGPDEFVLVLESQYDPPVLNYEEMDEWGLLDVVTHSDGSIEQLAYEMGVVAGVYASYVETGSAPPVLDVEVYERDEQTVAGWYWIEREWAEDYNAGNITGEEYSERILETVEPAA